MNSALFELLCNMASLRAVFPKTFVCFLSLVLAKMAEKANGICDSCAALWRGKLF